MSRFLSTGAAAVTEHRCYHLSCMIRRVASVLLSVLLAAAASAEIIDRIAAIVDDQVITTSEIGQLVEIRYLPRLPAESDDDYRARLLDDAIDQVLRSADIERFGAEPVPAERIDARIGEIASRFDSRESFDRALTASGMSIDALRDRITRRLVVDQYVDERFSPLVFVPLDEIDHYYHEVWLPDRLARDLPRVPLSTVRDELRATLKRERLLQEVDRWTAQLRGRANVDVYGAR